MLLVVGILGALLEARASGHGQVVDAAMVDGTALLTAMMHAHAGQRSLESPRGANLFDGGAPYYGVYQCADGGWLSLGAIEPKFYADLAAGLGLASELPAAGQHDRDAWPRQRALIAKTIAGRSRDEWVGAFAGTGRLRRPGPCAGRGPSAPAPGPAAGLRDADGLVQPAPAPRLSRTPGARGTAAPLVGEHTEAVLGDFGFSGSTVARLCQQA